jgi:hypothetical protein
MIGERSCGIRMGVGMRGQEADGVGHSGQLLWLSMVLYASVSAVSIAFYAITACLRAVNCAEWPVNY